MAQAKSAASRRQQIIEGALDALLTHGLPHVSYDRIAEAAGLTRQLVRYHFPEPDDLMLEVCNRMAETYRDALIGTAGQLDGPARVDAFLDFYFDLLEGRPKPSDDSAYDAMMSLATARPRVQDALADQYKLVGQVLSHEFAVQYSELDQRSAEELSYLFVSLMYGHWKMVASLGFSPSHNRIARQAMERLIRSYQQASLPTVENAKPWQRDSAS